MKKRWLWGSICLLLVVLLCFPVGAAQDCYRWYCKRNKNNLQPTLDANLQWITQYGGCYIDPVHGNEHTEKVLYLTFDAGYENGNVARILDTLKAEEVSGTFFVLDHLLLTNTDLVRRMTAEGHIVANHTAKHKDITKLESKEALSAELRALESLYYEKIGTDMPKYFRPPEGSFSKQSMQWLHELGYQTIFWSFAYADWDNQNQPTHASAKQKIMENLHNGAVLLLHPTSATNAAILGDVIRECKALGYRFGSLDELVANQESYR